METTVEIIEFEDEFAEHFNAIQKSTAFGGGHVLMAKP
jgi:hypothetical protein